MSNITAFGRLCMATFFLGTFIWIFPYYKIEMSVETLMLLFTVSKVGLAFALVAFVMMPIRGFKNRHLYDKHSDKMEGK